MTWQLEWGPQLPYLLELQAAGMAPKALETRPALDDRLAYYFRAFNRCSRARSWSDGSPQPITLGEVNSFFSMFAIDDHDMREQILDHIQDLDNVYRTHIADENAKSAETAVAEDTAAPR